MISVISVVHVPTRLKLIHYRLIHSHLSTIVNTTLAPTSIARLVKACWFSLFGVALLLTAWVGDNTYMTFRTIDNFVHGYGLRWNVAERVQAYTHPLWMSLVAVFYWWTGEPYFTSIALSIALTLLAVWLLMRLAPSIWSAGAGLTILWCSRAFIDYSTSRSRESPDERAAAAVCRLLSVTAPPVLRARAAGGSHHVELSRCRAAVLPALVMLLPRARLVARLGGGRGGIPAAPDLGAVLGLLLRRAVSQHGIRQAQDRGP